MINKQQVMCLIGVVIVCTAVAWWHGYKQLEQNTIERRVSWRTAEQWMLQSLPGLGPKKVSRSTSNWLMMKRLNGRNGHSPI